MRKTLLLGGPGTGKTKTLLDVMEGALSRGVHPSQVALVTFTNAAEDHARAKAMSKFGLAEEDLPYFRTIHSIGFRELGLSSAEVLTDEHVARIAELTGELVGSGDDGDAPAAGMNADPLLTIDHYARTTLGTLRAAWEDHGGDLDWYRLLRFSKAYHLYKDDEGLFDFTDMLSRYVESWLPPCPVRVAIIDEYQDLTMLQVATAEKAFAGAEELWVAGDDDQSVHRWAGAAEDHLLALDYPRVVLPLSHRLPRAVFDLSQEIVSRIAKRWPKDTRPSDRPGLVEWVRHADEVDLSSGTWLMLARTRSMLPELVAVAREQGVVYELKGKPAVDPDHVAAIKAHERLRRGESVGYEDATIVMAAANLVRDLEEHRTYDAAALGYDAKPIWHDALVGISLYDREYYLACLRRGEKLTEPARVRVETIHGAKGAEAENVLLKTDLSWRTQRGFELDPDSEHRVFYVGATRASERLFPVAPSGPYRYDL